MHKQPTHPHAGVEQRSGQSKTKSIQGRHNICWHGHTLFNRLILLALTTRPRHVCNKFLSTLPSLSNHYQHLCLQCKCILAFALTTLSLVHNNRPRVLATAILNIGQLLPDTLRELASLAVRTIKRDNQILVHVVNSRHRRDDCSST